MKPGRPESLLLFLGCVVAAFLGIGAGPAPASPGATAASASASVMARLDGGPPLAGPESASPLYPPAKIPLKFDHARHVGEMKLTCAYCHTAATTSRKVSDRLLAPPSRCDACHGTDHDDLLAVKAGVGQALDCAFCHEGHRAEDGGRVARVVMPDAFLRFDHAAHTARGVPCERCHQGMASATTLTPALPAMDTCLDCHQAGASAESRSTCDVCHLTEQGRLRTRFPGGLLTPSAGMHDAEHGPDFILRHKTVAAADSAFCATCHAERECVDCHDGRVRPRAIHPNDWIALHAVAARQNDPPCTSCHHEQSFCLSCHQRVGIALSSPSGAAADRGRFHPPKATWTDLPKTAAHHSWEAERNLSACVSCHTERDCALCHATAARGGRGGLSPHPPGFDASCRGAFARNARPCLYCHDAADGNLAPCR